MIDTPQTGEQLGRILDEVANSLYQDLARNCPEGDDAKTAIKCLCRLAVALAITYPMGEADHVWIADLGDEAFKTRLHQCILMLQRFEKQMKKQKNGLKEEEDG